MIIINIKILPINKSNLIELALLMAWRSNPEVFKFFKLQNGPLIWNDHYKFITESSDRLDYLVYIDNRPIGHLALSSILSEYPEISILLGETTLWGKGLSTLILNEFIKLLRLNDYKKYSARISSFNLASIRLFEKIGFIYYRPIELESNWGIYLLDSEKKDE